MRSRLFFPLLVLLTIFSTYRLLALSRRDPTSFFFNPRIGYAPSYSAYRTKQAEHFIASAPNLSDPVARPANQRRLCIGIPSIARTGATYLHATIGSLLEGLTPAERSDIFLIVFISHSNPSSHPAFAEQWLPKLADQVLTYDVDGVQMERIKSMEREGGMYREKGLYDYSYLLRECYRKETPYIAVLEDDVVAVDGWYARTVGAIERAESESALKRAKVDFLYLRLFYTEEFLGWNTEHWKMYLGYSVVFSAAVVAGVAVARRVLPGVRRAATGRRWVGYVLVACAGVILGFFAVGRMTVLPLREGVSEMPKYGCCSQGLVFPRQKAMSLIHWFENKRYGFVDVLLEEYADLYGELRWAVTPSVIQHIGSKSSKIDDYGPESKYGLSVAEKIWSFGFERYRVEDLRREHDSIRQREIGVGEKG